MCRRGGLVCRAGTIMRCNQIRCQCMYASYMCNPARRFTSESYAARKPFTSYICNQLLAKKIVMYVEYTGYCKRAKSSIESTSQPSTKCFFYPDVLVYIYIYIIYIHVWYLLYIYPCMYYNPIYIYYVICYVYYIYNISKYYIYLSINIICIK